MSWIKSNNNLWLVYKKTLQHHYPLPTSESNGEYTMAEGGKNQLCGKIL